MSTTATTTAAPPRRRVDWSQLAARYGTVGAAVLIFAVFAAVSSQFTSANNISNILVQVSVLTVISSGLTVAVASGEFDLSVGQVAGLSGVLVPISLEKAGVDPAVSSAVFVTMATDVMGFFSFLGLATLWGLGAG